MVVNIIVIYRMIKTVKIETPLGEMVAGATDDGICLLEFIDRRMLPTEYKDLTRLLKTTLGEGDNIHLESLRNQLNEYFTGDRREFNISLVTPGTDFQQEVWKELMKIPYGTTRSYQEQANA